MIAPSKLLPVKDKHKNYRQNVTLLTDLFQNVYISYSLTHEQEDPYVKKKMTYATSCIGIPPALSSSSIGIDVYAKQLSVQSPIRPLFRKRVK